MKRWISFFLSAILLLGLCACGNQPTEVSSTPGATPSSQPKITSAAETEQSQGLASETPAPTATPASSESPEESEAPVQELRYPLTDEGGRVHHLIYLNGERLETQHDAYTYPDEPKGAYYPIVEILAGLGIDCLCDPVEGTLKTKINGELLTCHTDSKDITIGRTTLTGATPEYVDDCYYVPSYTFMRLMDAVVDFTPDRSGVTITTEFKINPSTSGTDGISLSDGVDLGDAVYSGSGACKSCHGTGKSVCVMCNGSGNVPRAIPGATIGWSYSVCPNCSATGRRPCPSCKGTGRG